MRSNQSRRASPVKSTQTHRDRVEAFRTGKSSVELVGYPRRNLRWWNVEGEKERVEPPVRMLRGRRVRGRWKASLSVVPVAAWADAISPSSGARNSVTHLSCRLFTKGHSLHNEPLVVSSKCTDRSSYRLN